MPEICRGKVASARAHSSDGVVFISEKDSTVPVEMEIEREKLRRCWQLASVLNFVGVFEPVIQSKLKASAEEIESALIVPNDLLAQLHIALLKGLMTSGKKIDYSEAWMALLAKKLAMWWPWVAEGNFPLDVAKGEEAIKYKELDPTIRLMLLKALCEIRADQADIMSYVNDTIKNENGLSTFRKEALGADVNGTIYWYDGNSLTGHRLYKEVRALEIKTNVNGKESKTGTDSQWETVATNLEEFRKVLNEFSSSQVHLEVTVSKAVQTHAIPALERLHKKKARLQKLMRRQEMFLSCLQTQATRRSFRTRRPVNYRFDQYDKAIEEATEVSQVTQKRKTSEVQGSKEKNSKCGRRDQCESAGELYPAKSRGCNSSDSDSDTESDKGQESDDGYGTSDASDGKNRCTNVSGSEDDKARAENCLLDQIQSRPVHRPKNSHSSEKATGTATGAVSEGTNLTTKQKLRQRPTMNTALESVIVLDSEDEN